MKMILTLFFLATQAAADPNMFEDFSEGSETRWRYTSDRVMGGVSDGSASLGRDGDVTFAQLRGTVSTANNGGFIQIRTALAAPIADDASGLRLRVRGNGAPYYVHIRPDFSRRPWQFYQASFETTDAWQEVSLPWESFAPQGGLSTGFTPSDIRSIGLVAYGADYEAVLDVDWVAVE